MGHYCGLLDAGYNIRQLVSAEEYFRTIRVLGMGQRTEARQIAAIQDDFKALRVRRGTSVRPLVRPQPSLVAMQRPEVRPIWSCLSPDRRSAPLATPSAQGSRR